MVYAMGQQMVHIGKGLIVKLTPPVDSYCVYGFNYNQNNWFINQW